MTRRKTAAAPTPSMFPERILANLKAPGAVDDTTLKPTPDGLRCVETGAVFPFIEGIPSLCAPSPGEGTDVTERVKGFYEEHPFPGYEGLEEFGELVAKGSQNPFSARLLEAIGYNKTVLECGCGTGQLSHFLQLNNNHVLGVDMSLASLRLAIEHKKRNVLVRSSFAQMNIFELAVKDDSFDAVIAHGVLHHTFDAHRAFAAIVRKVKPDGIVVVGLYNKFARIPTWLRSKVISFTGGNIDYVVRTRIRDSRKAEIWIKDQYYNPHETWHSIGEVLDWFEDSGVDYLNCSPPILGTDGETAESLLGPTSPGDAYRRAVTQLSWIATIAREGGLFDVIGRKRG
ncbi:MAG: class I SAM-dependent methyltransferase [Rhodospirillales bacterium]